MDEKTLHEAMENISVIKGVMERTSKLFTAFSRVFIGAFSLLLTV